MNERRGENISKALLGGKDWKQLLPEIRRLAFEGMTSLAIASQLGISYPCCRTWARRVGDSDLLAQLDKNMRTAKSISGKRLKGRVSPLKGRTYEDILGSKSAARRRAAVTSEWMKGEKNIRKHCTLISKPQRELYEIVKQKFPDAVLEFPVKVKRGLTFWLDIAIERLKLDIEYDGAYWHERNKRLGKMPDERRDRILNKYGWTVIRVSESDKNYENFRNFLQSCR